MWPCVLVIVGYVVCLLLHSLFVATARAWRSARCSSSTAVPNPRPRAGGRAYGGGCKDGCGCALTREAAGLHSHPHAENFAPSPPLHAQPFPPGTRSVNVGNHRTHFATARCLVRRPMWHDDDHDVREESNGGNRVHCGWVPRPTGASVSDAIEALCCSRPLCAPPMRGWSTPRCTRSG